MTAFFDYPKSAAFGRVVPKNKIYEHAGANATLKSLFVREVDQVVWRFKLAPETTNLSATKSVPEIQIFSISLKTGDLDEAVLRAIDKAIPFPLMFELSWHGKRKVIAALKRPSEADRAKWKISEYFSTDWVAEDLPRSPLPVVLNLGALYDALLGSILSEQQIPEPFNTGLSDISQARFNHATPLTTESIATRVERIEAIRLTAREVDRIKARLAREKQFNKRVAINAELREAKLAFERLTRMSAPMTAPNE